MHSVSKFTEANGFYIIFMRDKSGLVRGGLLQGGSGTRLIAELRLGGRLGAKSVNEMSK